MLYKPGQQVIRTFVVRDADGDNVSGLSWTLLSFTKAGVRVTSGTEYDSIAFTEDASNEFYKMVFTPAGDSTVSFKIAAKSDAAIADVFEQHLEPIDRISDGILDAAASIETGLTLRQAMRGLAAALLGKITVVGGTAVTVRDVNDLADRIVATVDASGNRTSITLTLD